MCEKCRKKEIARRATVIGIVVGVLAVGTTLLIRKNKKGSIMDFLNDIR